MAFKGVRSGKAPLAPPAVPMRAQYVLGSRPGTLRAPPVPRIKPAAASTTQYGKNPNQANPAGASFGNTGQTNMS